MRSSPLALLSLFLLGLVPGCATPKESPPSAEESEFARVLIESIHQRIDEMGSQDFQFEALATRRPYWYWDSGVHLVGDPVPAADGVCRGADLISGLRESYVVAPLEVAVKRMREAWKVVWIDDGKQALLAGYLLSDKGGSAWFVWTEALRERDSVFLLDSRRVMGDRIWPSDWPRERERFYRFCDFFMGHCIAIDGTRLSSLAYLRALNH